eukprot:sb/3479279/
MSDLVKYDVTHFHKRIRSGTAITALASAKVAPSIPRKNPPQTARLLTAYIYKMYTFSPFWHFLTRHNSGTGRASSFRSKVMTPPPKQKIQCGDN